MAPFNDLTCHLFLLVDIELVFWKSNPPPSVTFADRVKKQNRRYIEKRKGDAPTKELAEMTPLMKP